MRVSVKTCTQDQLLRLVEPEFSKVCVAVSVLHDVVENRKESVVKISVVEQCKIEDLTRMPPIVANICGKITHNSAKYVHNPSVRPYVYRHKNNFGLFDCLITTACNFHTGSTGGTTMFKAGMSRNDISEAISHAFVADAVYSVLVNNVVYSSRLGHPVSKYNEGIHRALLAIWVGDIELCLPMDECMFVHSFLLQMRDSAWLTEAGLPGVSCMKVRINICRTGIVNFFFGIAGGVPLDSAPEERLCAVCSTLYDAIARVV